MTKRQFQKKTKSMLPSVMRNLRTTIDRLISSGAIDLESADDFVLPKAVLCAALQQEVNQWRMPYQNGPSKDERNLMHF